MKRSIVIIFLLMPLLSSGFNILKGRVFDKDGKPLPGAVVVIPDLRIGTTADSLGQYEIDNLPKGDFLIQVRLLTFASFSETVHVEGEQSRDFTLNESVIERNEVIVTGTSLATEERKSVTPIQSVSLKTLNEQASSNIIDALSKLPGVSQVSTGPSISKPVIRGLGFNRIITLNDGLRQEGQQWGDEHGIEIDDQNVSRVEVLKGPASLAYGSDALAGVINILSADPAPKGRIEGELNAGYQSNSGLASGHARLSGNLSGLSWSGYYTYKAAHDYSNVYDGAVFNTRFRNNNYGVSIGLHRKWGNSTVSFSSFNQLLGIAEGDRDSATGKFLMMVNDAGTEAEQIVPSSEKNVYTPAFPRQQINHNKIAWNNNLYLGNAGRMALTLGFQQNSRKEFEDVLLPEEPGLSLLLNTINYDLKYYFPTIRHWQITAGVNGMQQQNSNKGIEFLVPDYKLFDAGVYAIARKEWKRWSVSGGLRYDNRKIVADALYTDSSGNRTTELISGGETRFGSFERTFSNITGSLGTSFEVNKQTILKLNIASGYRAPNIAELSANGVHEGTIRYEYGNKTLRAERSIQADLGLNWSSEHVLVNAAVFYNHIDNFIFVHKLNGASGNDSIPAENNEEAYPAYSYDQQNAALYGGELFVDLHPHPLDWLHFENTFSYVRGHFPDQPDSLSNIPFIPAARWQPELRAQKQSLGKYLQNGYVQLGLDIVMGQSNVFEAYGTETATPGYMLLHAGLGCDIVNKKQKQIMHLSVSGTNLTNKAYQDHLSRLKYAPANGLTGRQGIWNMGRNVSVNVSVPLSFR